ncbi:MAG: hypothetical protein HF314_17065 [Ignavibacteria bacterium]|jgi:hypothetical protein|nr:hypothetical protein [Ignavibacteria bacterium]MCU7504796.1 hypothetical protein [Ignavibacteria bacterium]MCU7517682.1 hypothetical protein [Ignavibacteria bacterium]
MMLEKLRNSTFIFVLASLLFGAVSGFVDIKASEVQPAALLIIIFTCFLGFIQPRNAWLSALITGSSILAAHLISPFWGLYPDYPVEPSVWATTIALIPAFLGAYIGAAAGWALTGSGSKALK